MPMERNIVLQYKRRGFDYKDMPQYLREVARDLDHYISLGYEFQFVDPPTFKIEMVNPNVFALEPADNIKILDRPVLSYKWSTRTRNCLERAGIKTFADLVIKTESEMLKIKDFGRVSLRELKDFLYAHRLSLGMTNEWVLQATGKAAQNA